MKPSAFAGVVAQGKGPHARWTSAFDNVAAGAAEDLGALRILEPEIALVDGTVFHEEIETASDTLLRLGGDNKGFAIPVLNVARVVFNGSLDAGAADLYDGRCQGLLLANGDFFEGEFAAMEGE